MPFRYPSQVSLAVQSLTVLGSPTGGSFTLSTLLPLPVGTTVQIPTSSMVPSGVACRLPLPVGTTVQIPYYPGTEEAHTNPTRQRGECLRALAGASG